MKCEERYLSDIAVWISGQNHDSSLIVPSFIFNAKSKYGIGPPET